MSGGDGEWKRRVSGRQVLWKVDGYVGITVSGTTTTYIVCLSVCLSVCFQSDVTAEATLEVVQCHPGYAYNEEADMCVCRNDEVFEFNRCDNANRHFYVLVSLDTSNEQCMYNGNLLLSIWQ